MNPINNPNKISNPSLPIIIFILIFLTLVPTGIYAVFSGIKTNSNKTNETQSTTSIIDNIDRYLNALFPSPTQTPTNIKIVTPTIKKPSNNKVEINNEINTDNSTPSVKVTPVDKKYNYKEYPKYPTPTDYPTPLPGQPGSKEWDDAFWKQWNEVKEQNAASQKAVEESQKQFCLDHPDLCSN